MVLFELRKEITGRVIPKDIREYIGYAAIGLQGMLKNGGVSRGNVKTDFYTQSTRFGETHNKDGDYWDSTVEMIARAFAVYVNEKTEKNNDYLSAHAEAYNAIDIGKDGQPTVIRAYPVGEERVAINQAFDELFAALKADGFLHERTETETVEDVVQYARQGYWVPNLNSKEWNLVNDRMDVEIGWNKNRLDDATKWLYASNNGVSVFAIYGIGDGTVPTLLYASSGKKAAKELAMLNKYLEEHKYGFGVDGSGRNIDVWTGIIRDAKRKFGPDNDSVKNGRRTLGLDYILAELDSKIEELGTEPDGGRDRGRGVQDSELIEQSAYQTEKPLSNRDILEMAAGQIEVEGLTDQQKQALQNFKDRLEKQRGLEEQRNRLQQKQKREKAKGKDVEIINGQIAELDRRIGVMENQIATAEDSELYKNILKKARVTVERLQRAKFDKRLAKYRMGVKENQAQSKYRGRVTEQVTALMDILTKPDTKDIRKRIPVDLQKPILQFLQSIDFSSKRLLEGGEA